MLTTQNIYKGDTLMQFVIGEVFKFEGKEWTISELTSYTPSSVSFSAITYVDGYYAKRDFKAEKLENSPKVLQKETEKVSNN